MSLGESQMQDAIGIAILFAVAVCFRLYHSTVFVSFAWRDVIRLLPFNVIAFWVLAATSALWFLFAAFCFSIRPR
jgi:hypothetical protein